MKVLMLIPQAFYSTRGTPISAYHRARYIVNLGHEIDILTYPVGDQPPELDVKVYRSRGPHFANQIKQGPSYLKIWFDGLFFLNLIFRLFKKQYDLIYAHEEAGFMYALLLKFFKIPLVYDMHSSLPSQITEWEFSNSKIVIEVFRLVERFTLKRANVAVAISPGVAKAAKKSVTSVKVVVIPNYFKIDVQIFEEHVIQLRKELKVNHDQKMVLYTGSFVKLQSLDLLITAIPYVLSKLPNTQFVLVGGQNKQINDLQKLAEKVCVSDNLKLIIARPQSEMPAFIAAADVLVSPRIKGINPPGKLMSYLESGRPIVATDCYVHNQILDQTCAILTKPDPKHLAEGIIKALVDLDMVHQITCKAQDLINNHYSYENSRTSYQKLFEFIESTCVIGKESYIF